MDKFVLLARKLNCLAVVPFGFPFVVGTNNDDGDISVCGSAHGSSHRIRVVWGSRAESHCRKTRPSRHCDIKFLCISGAKVVGRNLILTSQAKIFITSRKNPEWVVNN